MPPFLPPAAASSEVLRTLKEKNEAERTFEAKVADVEIASEEIKSVRTTVDAQESTIQYAEGYRVDLELRLQTAQHLTLYFTNSAKTTQGKISEHKLQIQMLEDGLKLRQKELKKVEQNKVAAIEDKERAEAKLAAAKADYEKAFEAAKARGLLPELPGTTDPASDKRKSKSPERHKSKERTSSRRRSRTRSPHRRLSDRRRSRSRERPLPGRDSRDRRRSSPSDRRRDGRRLSPPRRRTPPRIRSPIGRRDPLLRRRSPLPARARPRSRERRRSPSPDRKRRRESSPRKKDRSISPEAERAKRRAKVEQAKPREISDRKRDQDNKDSKTQEKRDRPKTASPKDPPVKQKPEKESRPLEGHRDSKIEPNTSEESSKTQKAVDTKMEIEQAPEEKPGVPAAEANEAENDDGRSTEQNTESGDLQPETKTRKDGHGKKEKKDKKHKKEKKEKKESKREKGGKDQA